MTGQPERTEGASKSAEVMIPGMREVGSGTAVAGTSTEAVVAAAVAAAAAAAAAAVEVAKSSSSWGNQVSAGEEIQMLASK